jgi:ATP-binding cassette subfamily F protein uup
MEGRILEAETQLAVCEEAAADPAVATDHEAVQRRLTALAEAQGAVDRLYARWAELEAKLKD